MIEPGAFTEALSKNLDRWPWMLMTFLITIAIAWAVDNHALTKEEPRWLRWSEALGMACFFAVAQWVTIRLLLIYSEDPDRWSGRVGRMIITSTLVGAIIGALVPHYFRKRNWAEVTQSSERPVAFPGPAEPWPRGRFKE